MNDFRNPAARLYFLLARQAPVGVIFRRGPSKQVQLIRWNLQDDTFEPGQWFNGRIYERRSDLSPDGRLLVYFAAKQSAAQPGTETWTAISRPPYLTALSFWFKGDAWSGGGLFENNRHLKLNDAGPYLHRLAESSVQPPIKVSKLGAPQGENDPIDLMRLTRDGWQLQQDIKANYGSLQTEAELAALDPENKDVLIAILNQARGKPHETQRGIRYDNNSGFRTYQPRLLEKAMDKGGKIRVSCKSYIFGFRFVRLYTITGEKTENLPDLAGAEWAEVDKERERIVFVKAGALFSWQPGSPAVKQLADFNANRFEELPAPDWAKKW